VTNAADPNGFAVTYGFGLLYEKEPTFDVASLVARLSPEMKVEIVSQSSAVVQLAHTDHLIVAVDGEIPALTNIVRWFKPLDASDFDDALAQTWDWPEAEDVVARCRYKWLVSDLTGAYLPYKERFQPISTVAIAMTELTNPSAVHWEPAGCIVQPTRLRRRLRFYCNVRLHNIVNHKGDELMDTLGLAAIGLIDGQCLYRGLDSSEMARWMYGLAGQIFTKGAFIKDGEATAGLNAAEKWICRRETSLIPPARTVVDATPRGKHAGHR